MWKSHLCSLIFILFIFSVCTFFFARFFIVYAILSRPFVLALFSSRRGLSISYLHSWSCFHYSLFSSCPLPHPSTSLPCSASATLLSSSASSLYTPPFGHFLAHLAVRVLGPSVPLLLPPSLAPPRYSAFLFSVVDHMSLSLCLFSLPPLFYVYFAPFYIFISLLFSSPIPLSSLPALPCFSSCQVLPPSPSSLIIVRPFPASIVTSCQYFFHNSIARFGIAQAFKTIKKQTFINIKTIWYECLPSELLALCRAFQNWCKIKASSETNGKAMGRHEPRACSALLVKNALRNINSWIHGLFLLAEWRCALKRYVPFLAKT